MCGRYASTRRPEDLVEEFEIAEEMIEGYATVAVARRVRPDVAVICEATGRRVAVGQRGRVARLEQTSELLARGRVGVVVDPVADLLLQACVHRGSHSWGTTWASS